MTTLPKLTPAQQAAGIDRVDENIALQSGAGCGKTFVLARRFTELLIQGGMKNIDDPLSRFVALTFTDKAALEMSQRVRAMLKQFAARAKGEDRRRFAEWIEKLPEARISTIHSFCASLLRSNAIQAGLDPAFKVCADTFVTERLLAEAAEQALLEAVEARDFQVANMLAGISFDRVVKQVRWLVDQRSAVDLGDYDDPQQTLQRWQDHLEKTRLDAQRRLKEDSTINRNFEELQNFTCTDPTDKLAWFRAEVVSMVERILHEPLTDTAQTFDALAQLRMGNIGSAKSWGSKENVQAVRGTATALRSALAEYAVFAGQLNNQDQAATETLQMLCSLAKAANRIYAAEKKSRGILDFTDLMTHSRNLLACTPALREKLSAGIDQLLIDEAQDTDAMQLEMLLGMLSGKENSQNALPAGKIFLVGDAKQSIYRFRGAQLEVFRNLCDRLGARQQIDLDISFRTIRPGSAFVNFLFRPIMGQTYSPVKSQRAETPDGPTVEILLADGTEEKPLANSITAAKSQAALTAERIEEMISNGERRVWDKSTGEFRAVRPGDIAILFARMTHSLTYERELQKRGLPYYVIGGTGFFHQQEVFDCINALRAIDNPYDDIAFIGLLRSAMIGLDDNALLHMAETTALPYLPNLTDEVLSNLAEKLSDAQLAMLRFARDMINELAACKDAIGIDELLRLVLRKTGYEATLLSQFQGRRMLGNVRMLMDQARPATGQISLAEFIEQIDEQVIGESKYEQAPSAGEDEDAIRLITIHKAKGLEFPVVFVPDLNIASQAVKDATLNRLDFGLVTKLQPGLELEDADDENDESDDLSGPKSYAVAKYLEKLEQEAEALRKYYVALTRHEDYLVLVGANWRTKDGAFRNKNCFLARLDESLNISNAIDAGTSELSYSDESDNTGGTENFVATVSCRLPQAIKSADRKSDSPGQAVLAAASSGEDITAGLTKLAKQLPPALPLIGPIPTTLGNVELAVTALSEFEQCPMLYHWRYELRGTNFEHKYSTPQSASKSPKSFDPLALGTLLHRCMELLDFENPQPAEVLLARAIADTEFSELTEFSLGGETNELMEIFDNILRKFKSHDLSGILGELEPSEIFRELDFISAVDPVATIRGQIDLLYRSGGNYHIVDYKSDRVSQEDHASLAEKAKRYELQMLIYAAAVSRYTGLCPADATLYFLRTGQTHKFDLTPSAIEASQAKVSKISEDLIQSRRTGQFRKCGLVTCDYCRNFA